MKNELKYLKEIQQPEIIIDPTDSERTLEEILALSLNKLKSQICRNPEFTRGESNNIEKVTNAFLKMQEEKRKEIEFSNKFKNELTEEETVQLLIEAFSGLSDENKIRVIEASQNLALEGSQKEK